MRECYANESDELLRLFLGRNFLSMLDGDNDADTNSGYTAICRIEMNDVFVRSVSILAKISHQVVITSVTLKIE